MPTFTANIAFMFAERPFLDRIAAAKAAGFDWVECHFPYEFSVAQLNKALEASGVRMNGLNTQPGDVGKGEWGLAGVPGREADFRRDFDQAASYARALGVGSIHVMAGVLPPSRHAEAVKTYIANLRQAARAAPELTLLLEPLNSRDKPDYLVSRSDQIAAIIAEIGEPNVKLLFDVYHVQVMEGDILKRLEKHKPVIGHVQIAAVPSRHEPDEGEIHFPAIFAALEAIGYDGLVGLEYKPRGRTEDGLAWRKTLGVG